MKLHSAGCFYTENTEIFLQSEKEEKRFILQREKEEKRFFTKRKGGKEIIFIHRKHRDFMIILIYLCCLFRINL